MWFKYNSLYEESKQMRSMTARFLCGALVAFATGCSATREAANEKMELGWISRQALDDPAYHAFGETYDTATIDNDIVTLIAALNHDVDILVFLGTWCGDSRREVPRFFRVVDAVGFPRERIRLYGLDRTKKSDDGMTERYAIERVPTFIFLKRDIEIGRITERPHASLEADMLAILADAQAKKSR
jgi:hypothetical protein